MLPQMRFPVLVNWHCTLSRANQPKIQKLEETRCVNITSNRTWPLFSAVTLLHPLPFKNSRSHKTAILIVKLSGCRYLFAHKSLVKSVPRQYSQAAQSNHLSDAFFLMFLPEVADYTTNN